MTMHQLFPYAGSVWAQPRTLTRQVWDAGTARSIPGVGRALDLYAGLIGQCALTRVRGDVTMSTPRLLERPDPDMAFPTFVGVHTEDFLLHGNAAHLVTARDANGWPAAVRWYSAHRWLITEDTDERGRPNGQPAYWLDGYRVPRDDVVHVRRGADPMFPWRGVGVVEQYLRTLDRVGLQEAAEAENLKGRGMPAVAVIAPNPELAPADADAVADKWVERFAGPEAKPGIFPRDTKIQTLSWTPDDAQMIQARSMSLKDVANIFNLDGYWLGAEGSSHTYRSPGPMFLTLLRVSLNPIMRTLEDEWSFMWLVRGQTARFDRSELLRDDLLSMVQAFSTGARFFPDPDEPRRLMGLPALGPDAYPDPPTPPEPTPPAPEPPADTPPTEDPAPEGTDA